MEAFGSKALCADPTQWILMGLLVCASATGAPAAADKTPKAGKQPAILFVTTRHSPMWRLYLKKYIREETRKGFQMDWRPWAELDWPHMRRFNVAVIVHPAHMGTQGMDKLPDAVKRGPGLFKRFLAQGGGIVVDPAVSGLMHQLAYLLKSYGGMMYVEEVHEAPGLVAVGTPFAIRFARTENIRAHPVTKGVRRLWYPFGAIKQWDTLCFPLETDDRWQVLVRGSKTSRSVVPKRMASARHDNVPKRATGVASEVPLVAVRQVGQGRMALLGIPEVFTYDAGLSPGIERVFLSKGLGRMPSDGATLLGNLYRWLAEPSMAAGTLGGWKTDPKRVRKASGAPKEWAPPIRRAFPKPRHTYHALVGVQSKRSGGTSTIPQYKAAAAKAGLDVVVFLEDITKIDRKAFERFKQDCRRESDAKLVLVPGLKMTDQSGNHYFMFGPRMAYPPTDAIDAQRRIRNLDRSYILNNCITVFKYVSLTGRYLFSRSGTPAWDLDSLQAMALATYDQDGRLVDQLPLEDYLAIQDTGNLLSPIAIHLVQDASSVGKAVRTGQQTYFNETSLAKLADNMMEHYYWPYSYTTAGPKLEAWQHINHEYSGYRWFDFDGMRWAIRYRLTSDAGLKRVDVYDGRRLLRSYRYHGEKEAVRDVHLLHDQQKDLLVVATDVKGRTATSGVVFGANWLQKGSWLSDRCNHATYCQQRNDSEWGFSFLWGPTIPGLYLMNGRFWTALSHDINVSDLTTPGFDGPPGNATAVWVEFWFHGKRRSVRSLEWAERVEQPLANQDCIIWESYMTHEYEPIPKRYKFNRGSRPPAHPSDRIRGYQRYVNFNIKYRMPAVSLVEGEVRFLKDFPLDPKRPLPVIIGNLSTDPHGDACVFAAQHTGGQDVVATFDRRRSGVDLYGVQGPLPKGSYITMFPSFQGSRTVFSLDDTLSFHYHSPGGCALGLRDLGDVIRKDTVLRWRYLMMTGMGRDRNATRKIETVRDVMGIDGSPGYRVKLEAGRILSQVFICRCKLDRGAAGIAGTFPIKGLPCTLPVVVEGVNPNWTAVLYERKNRRYRPIGMHDDKAYVQLGVGTDDPLLFIGHPLTCSDPDVLVHLMQWDKRSFRLVLHNPTSVAKKVTLVVSPYFTLLGKQAAGSAVDVPAGASVTRTIPMATQ